MTVEWKDTVYILVYVISVVGFLFTLQFKVKKIEEQSETLKRAVFQDKGGLNVVDHQACKDHREIIDGKIQRESRVIRKAFENIDCLNQNIITIMMHMKLKPVSSNDAKGRNNRFTRED